jgi:hypothetical protein
MRRMAAEPAVWVLRVVGVDVEVMDGGGTVRNSGFPEG